MVSPSTTLVTVAARVELDGTCACATLAELSGGPAANGSFQTAASARVQASIRATAMAFNVALLEDTDSLPLPYAEQYKGTESGKPPNLFHSTPSRSNRSSSDTRTRIV